MDTSTFNIKKDPNAILDYKIDWSSWLKVGDTLTASSWTIPPGLVKTQDTFDDTSATVWLSGGKTGQSYMVTNRISTASNPSRVDDRTIRIDVVER